MPYAYGRQLTKWVTLKVAALNGTLIEKNGDKLLPAQKGRGGIIQGLYTLTLNTKNIYECMTHGPEPRGGNTEVHGSEKGRRYIRQIVKTQRTYLKVGEGPPITGIGIPAFQKILGFLGASFPKLFNPCSLFWLKSAVNLATFKDRPEKFLFVGYLYSMRYLIKIIIKI
jgi:hypothetical protein